MPLVAFFVYAGLSALAVVAARLLPKGRRLRLGLSIASLLGIIGKASFVISKELEPFFDGLDAFVWFERDLAIPFGVAFFAFIADLVDEERSRRAVKLMPVVLLGYLLAVNLWVFGTPECYVKSDGHWRKDVCLQSTNYTCGAASIATLLRAKGVKTTEHEAARLSCTIPDRGVTDLGATMALRKLMPGRPVAIRSVPIDALARASTPCLLPLRFNFWFDHMTVLLRVEGPDRFMVGDPLQGLVPMKRAEIEERYLGHVITVD